MDGTAVSMDMKGKNLKKKSFVKEILAYLLMLTFLMFVLLGVFLGSSYAILEREIQESSDAFLQIYSGELTSSMEKLNDVLKNITMQGEDLAGIKSGDENKRSLAAISLHNHMQEQISAMDLADIIVVYDDAYAICLDAIRSSIPYRQKNAVREYTIAALADEQLENAAWMFVRIDGDMYLCKFLKFNGRIIGLYTQMDHLLPMLDTGEAGGRSILLVNETGDIGKLWGEDMECVAKGANISAISERDYYVKKSDMEEKRLSLYCYTEKTGVFAQIHAGMILVAAVVCASVLFLLYILRYTRKEVLLPMRHMVEDMERIREGAYENRIGGDFDTEEFCTLQETTNQMVEEIVGLKIRAYEEQLELQGMELKSIRLQLKPHFFLNALTMISSLSSQNKNAQIQAYINALSKNVRYMFRTGFHTVPLKEEIRHVENYFEMQDLKYPGCVFYIIDLPEQLEDWQIPQMLIHTFIENEYKYAVSMEEMLTVLIKISEQEYQGERMLLIEIEDDGKGYPGEVLDYMSGRAEWDGATGGRVGLWSIKRMMELMYERKGLVQLSNIVPCGCMNRIYVPKLPRRILEEGTLQKTI